MNDRLFGRTTGAENGIWQRNDTWPDRVEMTKNEWLLTPLLRNIERMDPAMGKPVLVDIGPSSAGEVINLGRLLNSRGTKIIVVEADLDAMNEIEKGIMRSDVLWLKKPILYHGNGWKFGQAINAMEDDGNSLSSKKSVIGVVAMNNLALATNFVGKESSGLLINGFMDDARNYLSPYGSISLSVATAGLLIERPPIGFSDNNIEFVIKEGSAKEARFMGGQRTKAEYLYSKVWDVWLKTLVERDDFCFLDADNKRTDNLNIEYSNVPTGHDFWSLPYSEELTSFEQS